MLAFHARILAANLPLTMPAPVIASSLVPHLPKETLDRYHKLCIKHQARYMQIWLDCIKEDMGGLDSRYYALLEIVRLVESGKLSGDLSDLKPDMTGSKEIVLPSEDAPGSDVGPTEDEAHDALFLGPLPPNPAHAPLKIGIAPKIMPRCDECGGISPCHHDWCHKGSSHRDMDHVPGIPQSPAVAATGPKPGDKIPARFPWCKDRYVPFTWADYYAGRADRAGWYDGDYD